MHVDAKKLTLAGVMLALAEILLYLSGILEINTLFLLAAASFFTGIMIREGGMGYGGAFYAASVLLGLLITPNKLYCLTYAAMGIYLLITEAVYRWLGKYNGIKGRRIIFPVLKFVVFNCFYIPALIFLPGLLFPAGIEGKWLTAAAVIGQAALIVYDLAYEYFMGNVWERLRRRLKTAGEG